MNQKETEVIVGLLSGMQTAIVHLSNVVAAKSGINPEELATSYEATAESIPEEVLNRALLQLVLRQVASGIRSSGAGDEYAQLISRLLH